jgi:FKBP-type peptidyl-prolyl cis-trans isomerase FkpA
MTGFVSTNPFYFIFARRKFSINHYIYRNDPLRMKYFLVLFPALFIQFLSVGQVNKITAFTLPDSVKAVQFLAEFTVHGLNTHKEVSIGIKTDLVHLTLETGKRSTISFEFPGKAQVVAKGLEVKLDDNDELEWEYSWAKNEPYRLLISNASDSAENFIVYSGYIWIPNQNKWKLIGTCKIPGRWGTIKEPAIIFEAPNKKLLKGIQVQTGQVWIQRNNGSWKNLQGNSKTNPIVAVASHIDSLQQHKNDISIIRQAIESGKTDAKNVVDDVYYVMLKEGTGRQVLITDTVVVYYKGSLLSDGTIFDQTKEKPATFPLNRLIRGWHIGVPLCKVGGKIKIVIPSALAYSIRTRAAKIPPNSILVFEIEVLEARGKE